MTFAEQVAKATNVSTARTEIGVFRRMVGLLAEVNIGTSTVLLPCDGFYPPVPGMPVRVTWFEGKGAVTGPARPLGARGQITATGTPTATVLVGTDTYQLYVRSGYTPVVGDVVSVDWSFEGGLITGKVTGFVTPTPPDAGDTSAQPFTNLVVRAADSGRYQNSWWGNDPWASASNNGIWVYGNRVRDSLAGATITKTEIYLPLVQELSGGSLAQHSHPTIPAGAPSLSNVWVPPTRDGWVTLPTAWGAWLAAGGRGVGVTNGGYTIWSGTASDSMSGALRFAGTR